MKKDKHHIRAALFGSMFASVCAAPDQATRLAIHSARNSEEQDRIIKAEAKRARKAEKKAHRG